MLRILIRQVQEQSVVILKELAAKAYSLNDLQACFLPLFPKYQNESVAYKHEYISLVTRVTGEPLGAFPFPTQGRRARIFSSRMN